MCYEFDEMYRKAREAEEAQKEEGGGFQGEVSRPRQAAAPEVKPREPVPA